MRLEASSNSRCVFAILTRKRYSLQPKQDTFISEDDHRKRQDEVLQDVAVRRIAGLHADRERDVLGLVRLENGRGLLMPLQNG